MAATEVEAQATRPDDVLRIEHLIQQGESRLVEARTALRHFLLAQTGEPEAEGSIGDALAALVRQPVKSQLAAIMILRCLAIQGTRSRSQPIQSNHSFGHRALRKRPP